VIGTSQIFCPKFCTVEVKDALYNRLKQPSSRITTGYVQKNEITWYKKGLWGQGEVINQCFFFKSFEFSDQQRLGCCVGSLQPPIHGS